MDPPAPTTDPTLGCNDNEMGYRGSCYSLVTDMYAFSSMEDICELRSSKLVSISDASENNFVMSLMQTGISGNDNNWYSYFVCLAGPRPHPCPAASATR